MGRWSWIFGKTEPPPVEELPHGRIVEGPMTIQCVCPVCPYAQGYNEPFLASFYEQVPVTCKKCKTRFIALQ